MVERFFACVPALVTWLSSRRTLSSATPTLDRPSASSVTASTRRYGVHPLQNNLEPGVMFTELPIESEWKDPVRMRVT